MKKVSLLLFALLLIPQIALAAPKDNLSDAYKDYYESRVAVNKNWEALMGPPDSFAVQRLETSLSDALTLMDGWTVDKCWLPWYAIARAEFEIQVQIVALGKAGFDAASLSSMHYTATNLGNLNARLFQTAFEECV